MLRLPINDYNKIIDAYNVRKHEDESDFKRFVLDDFFDMLYINSNITYDRSILDAYIDGLNELFNHELDYRNPNCNIDNIINIVKNGCQIGSPVLWFPIKSKINHLCGEDIFLFGKHINNADKEVIGISRTEIIDVIFYLNSQKIFSDNIISKYVDSTSTHALLSSMNLMDNRVKSDSDKVADKDEPRVNNYRDLVFDKDLKIYEMCNAKDEHLDISLDGLYFFVAQDIKKMIQSNRLNTFYIRTYLHPYLEFYLLKIEELIKRDDAEAFSKLIKLIFSTTKVFNEYHHELTRYLLCVMYLVTKLPCVICMDNSVDEKLKERYRTKFLRRFICEETPTSCSIFDMMKMMDHTFEQYGGKNSNEKRLLNKLIKESHDNFNEMYQLTSLSENSVYSSVNENLSNGNRIEPVVSQAITALNEAFEIRKDGTIKVVLKGRVSLMDEYAANHRLLKLNEQSGDTESMKYNLVYALLIVESADRILHNSKISQSSKKYQDAEKAKSFATNDIVTYLPKVKLRDKSFDLNTFYKKVRADEYTIEVDGVSMVEGIKKIVGAILR